ncbi:MAG: septation protein SepH [Labedaea sp.]
MRALRIVGLEDDGPTVNLEDSAPGERFQLPPGERLRAAARGDITRLGQIAIELESQMRPREIQARIRAGESVEQVAAAAGVPEHRVERFAYPVLLERSRTAELAQRAHPVREDGPDVQTLGEVVAHAFGTRGQDYSIANWDSWRGEDGKWVVQLSWTAGRSFNRAHWAFHPGAHGGTVTPLDDHSHDLLDPTSTRPLRTVRPVTQLAQQALEVARTETTPARHAVNGGEAPRGYTPPEQYSPAAPPTTAPPEPETRTEQDFVQDFELTPEPAQTPSAEPSAAAPPAAEPKAAPAPAAEPPARPEPEPEPEPAPAAEPPAAQQPPAQQPPAAPAQQPAARRTKGKKARPMVPSWEDVLLGTRSNRG